MSPKRALAILIVVSGLVRLAAAGTLGLGNDEAYHFLYAVHPDLSYYDHPPMLAWVETIGLTLSGAVRKNKKANTKKKQEERRQRDEKEKKGDIRQKRGGTKGPKKRKKSRGESQRNRKRME